MPAMSDSSKSDFKETSPDDSPDSHNDIGRIFSHPKRPVPVCITSFILAGTLEPVKMYNPKSSAWSASNLILSHNVGANCHSSIKRGFSPCSKSLGLIMASCLFCSILPVSDIYSTLWAICSAVVVFPHHLAPSISMAPLPANLRINILSTTRCLYTFFILNFFVLCKVIQNPLNISILSSRFIEY